MPETDIDALTRASVPDDWTDLDRRAVDTVRVLAADAVQKVGNGHPGTAMSLAPLAYSLFQRVMRHDPTDPDWIGRDRFVLSAGHSSLTLYIQLYLSGYGLELADLEALRTWGSKTPGHPEHRHTPGVEITTGPLGQGLASAVGMAMAARRERGLFDPDAAPGESPFDHQIYVIASDGDIEEGVTSEASSLAGTQQLGNLTVVYDDNKISIEDDTTIALSEDTAKRYEAYGWHVQVVEGGENVTGILEALENARAETDRPSFILLRTVIAFPAPKAMNTGKAHGSALGDDEVKAVKEVLGFDPEQTFEVDDEVLAHARKVVERGAKAHEEWTAQYESWAAREPERKELLDRMLGRDLPVGWEKALPVVGARQEGGRHPQGLRRGAQGAGRRAARAVGRLGGPRGEQQHHDGGRELVRPEVDRHEDVGRRALRAHPALRGPRARDGRDPQRHRPARAHPPLRRHVPHVQRLHARRRAPRGGDEVAGRSTCGPTTRSASARTGPPTSRSSTWPRCARSRTSRSCAPATRTRPRTPGRRCWRTPRAPRASALTRQNIPVLEGTSAEGVARGGYVLADASGRRPAAGAHRHRLGAADRRRRPRGARGRRHPHPGRVDAVHGLVRGPGPGVPRLGAAAVGEGPRLGRGRDRHAVVPLGRATPARSSPSSTTAPAPTTRPCSASSASPPSTS